MFEYLEPDPSDNQEAGALPLPPKSGPNDRGARPLTPEKVRHMLYGSLAAIDRTIKILHALGYADPNDWSDPIPVPPITDGSTTAWSSSGVEKRSSSGAEKRSLSGAEVWMVIMTKTVLLE
ncbi:hypothetical protein IQ273_05260 [Nodosilinea sp. LEGE 07298]|uniref:hypothetical protein n=1 Tax=Nodosilinea sp. LEGE 07298 TaxID=2777970 RepID=UPI0018826DEE|nr:hypothetical protein [Nodosilinea sp. LEGE 07298]MBE9108825.1 hypothetical protein [Nodosilinea sp. LEGE 07298]